MATSTRPPTRTQTASKYRSDAPLVLRTEGTGIADAQANELGEVALEVLDLLNPPPLDLDQGQPITRSISVRRRVQVQQRRTCKPTH